MTDRRPNGHALKPNHRDRIQRDAVIDNLIGRALRGVLTIPEAAVLAEYWREDRRIGEKTRRRLTDTTRALQRHREAADAEIRGLEAQIAALVGEPTPAHNSGPTVAEAAADDARWWGGEKTGE